MGLDRFTTKKNAGDQDYYGNLSDSTVYREDAEQTYVFTCPECDNEMEKTTSGEYYPKTHLCKECMTWLWIWVNGGKIYQDKLTVKPI